MADPRSAVVLVETPEYFVLQRRPNLSGNKLAYPGRIQFLGGGANEGEGLFDTAARELSEETDLPVQQLVEAGALTYIWEAKVDSVDKTGAPLIRHVGLFRLALGAPDFDLKEQGELVRIVKTPEAVEDFAKDLAPFALNSLRKVVRGETWH